MESANIEKGTQGNLESIYEKNDGFVFDETPMRNLIDYFDKEIFKNFLNQIDSLKKNTDTEKVENLLDINIDNIAEVIDADFSLVIEKINNAVKEDNVDMVEHNSFRDVLINSIIPGINGFMWLTKNINSTDPKIIQTLKNPNSSKRILVEKYLKKAIGSKGSITYYLKEVCNDKEKLKIELSSEAGFVDKFEEYFKKNPSFLVGSKKIPYFKFFSEAQKGNITLDNIERNLEKLDSDIIDKEKIINNIHNILNKQKR